MLQACLAVEQQLTEKGKNNIAFRKGASFDLSIRKKLITLHFENKMFIESVGH